VLSILLRFLKLEIAPLSSAPFGIRYLRQTAALVRKHQANYSCEWHSYMHHAREAVNLVDLGPKSPR
jgi:hypothetical protein